jgi:hypothetical protein
VASPSFRIRGWIHDNEPTNWYSKAGDITYVNKQSASNYILDRITVSMRPCHGRDRSSILRQEAQFLSKVWPTFCFSRWTHEVRLVRCPRISTSTGRELNERAAPSLWADAPLVVATSTPCLA